MDIIPYETSSSSTKMFFGLRFLAQNVADLEKAIQ